MIEVCLQKILAQPVHQIRVWLVAKGVHQRSRMLPAPLVETGAIETEVVDQIVRFGCIGSCCSDTTNRRVGKQ
jgi:hypothetical protein